MLKNANKKTDIKNVVYPKIYNIFSMKHSLRLDKCFPEIPIGKHLERSSQSNERPARGDQMRKKSFLLIGFHSKSQW